MDDRDPPTAQPPTDSSNQEKTPVVIRPLSRQEALAIYRAGEEAVVRVLCELSRVVYEQAQRLAILEQRVKELEGQLAKNSQNSNRPPSSDGVHRPPRTQSLRQRSRRPAGGQEGHEGKTLQQVSNPDRVVRHPVRRCRRCRHSLKDVSATCERRQMFELPPIQIEVTEHQVEIKACPHCGEETRAEFPAGVSGPVNYGPRLQGLAVYLMNQQLLPYERVGEVFRDVFSLPISSGTVYTINRRCFDRLAGVSEIIRQQIAVAAVAHFDESGMNIAGKNHWLHCASTESLTHYAAHAKRGGEALEDIGILPAFRGRAVHDHWSSYFDYTDCTHSLCNAHHLRELTFIAEQEKEKWAYDMKDLLLDIHRAVQDRSEKGHTELSRYLRRRFEKCYDQILLKGLRFHLRLPSLPQTGTRGREKQRPGKNLIDRLKKNRMETLAFMYNFSIPFTNNLGERDIRMNKIKQKISGCFRRFHGAQFFCRIRGFISTARKQGWNILHAIESVLQGSPPLPATT